MLNLSNVAADHAGSAATICTDLNPFPGRTYVHIQYFVLLCAYDRFKGIAHVLNQYH